MCVTYYIALPRTATLKIASVVVLGDRCEGVAMLVMVWDGESEKKLFIF